MANFTTYLQMGVPQPRTELQTDNQNIVDAYGYDNYSWSSRLMVGSSQRISKYGEYDQMDNDVDVSRALDTIADEMMPINTTTNLPVDIIIQSDSLEKTPNNTINTLTTALRYWIDIHNIDTRLFNIARNMVKYGDVFFMRGKTNTTKWTYIPTSLVKGAIVDSSNVNNVIGWQIEKGNLEAQSNMLQSQVPNSFQNSQNDECDDVLAEDIIRFTLNNDVSVQAPFGISILQSIYKTHKQKDLIEDAIIIYRIQRAPERRVFYIDVSGMPPHRIKKHLENIKTDIRQRKTPSTSGGQPSVDSVYNPQSIGEDFYFSSRGDKGSRVETLPGGASVGETSDLEYFVNKLYRGLRIPSSYMQQGAEGAVFNDGRVGFAYIQELNFAKYAQRLQIPISNVLDEEFKKFLKKVGVTVNQSIFKIQLPRPNNFATYKQQALDSQLLSSYASSQDMTALSERFKLKKYLQLSEEELLRNEKLKAEEMGVELKDGVEIPIEVIVKLYGDPANLPNSEDDVGDDDLTPDVGNDAVGNDA